MEMENLVLASKDIFRSSRFVGKLDKGLRFAIRKRTLTFYSEVKKNQKNLPICYQFDLIKVFD